MPKAEFFKRHTYTPNEYYDFLSRINEGMAGDMVWRLTPAALVRGPSAAAWTQEVVVELVNAAGDVHEWYDATLGAGVGIVATSAGTGTAVLADGTAITFVDGRGEITVEGDLEWSGGVRQVSTTAIDTGATVASGTLTMTLTADVLPAPGTAAVDIPVANGDTTEEVATRVAAALNADPVISAVLVAEAVAASVITTLREAAVDDATVDLVLTEDDGTGVTIVATVPSTVAGVAPDDIVVTAEALAALLGQGPGAVTLTIDIALPPL